jgi:hypothetical protein
VEFFQAVLSRSVVGRIAFRDEYDHAHEIRAAVVMLERYAHLFDDAAKGRAAMESISKGLISNGSRMRQTCDDY